MSENPTAVVFDIGRVLYDWNLRHLFAKLIADPAELDWFLANVVTEDWHFQSDTGRPLGEMLPELKARFPDHAPLWRNYGLHLAHTGASETAKPWLRRYLALHPEDPDAAALAEAAR